MFPIRSEVLDKYCSVKHILTVCFPNVSHRTYPIALIAIDRYCIYFAFRQDELYYEACSVLVWTNTAVLKAAIQQYSLHVFIYSRALSLCTVDMSSLWLLTPEEEVCRCVPTVEHRTHTQVLQLTKRSAARQRIKEQLLIWFSSKMCKSFCHRNK